MSLPFSFRLGALFCIFVWQFGHLMAQSEEPEVVELAEVVAAQSYRLAIDGLDPMALVGVDSRVAHILGEYYLYSFGGAKTWERIESVRFEGVLRLSNGSLSFVAFKKKPDYCKIVLFVGKARIVLSFDGVDAWQLNTAESSGPVAMPPLEALNFIRDASTAGHLVYPTLLGKTIELLGTREVDGFACYDLRVTLPSGQQVTYAIDRSTFVERQQIVVNAVSGRTEVTTHEELKVIEGVSMPIKSTMEADGEFVQEVRMSSIEVNVGAMPWMFERPAGFYIPGRLPEGAVEPDLELDEDLSYSNIGNSEMPGVESFGLSEPSVGAFDASRFPDLDAKTTQSILDDLDELK